jgi:hypothetical protein
LAYFQGDLHGVQAWITVGVVILSFAGTPVLVRRGLRAAQAIEQALDRTVGPGWRQAGSVAARPPWARVVLLPLPIFHPGVKRTSNLRYGPARRRNRLDLYRRRDARSGGPC